MRDIDEGHVLDTDSESIVRSPEQFRPESLIRKIFRRRGPVDTRSDRKRSASKTRGKDHLIGTNGVHITRDGKPNKGNDKRKRRCCGKDKSHSKKEKDYRNNHRAKNIKHSGVAAGNIVVSNSAKISVAGDRGCSESFSVEDTTDSSESELKSITRGVTIHEIVRKHFRMLMFPTQTSLTGYYVPKIPWLRLGSWLHLKKKRFVNWPGSVSFFEGNVMANIPANELRKLLFVDLVDWTRDEIKYKTIDTSLILDSKGRVLVKTSDLGRMYPGRNMSVIGYKQPLWFSDSGEDSETRDETPSLTNVHSPASSTSSSRRSAVSLLKRKRYYSKENSIAVMESDKELGSDSQNEEVESVSASESEVSY